MLADPKYISIKIKNLREDLQAAEHFHNKEGDDYKTKEYLEAVKNGINKLLNLLED